MLFRLWLIVALNRLSKQVRKIIETEELFLVPGLHSNVHKEKKLIKHSESKKTP